MRKINISSFAKWQIISIVLFLLLTSGTANSQVVAIKKWKGTYPEMNDKYPVTFIAFKGFLPPIAHVFLRIWPTHYYWDINSAPTTDEAEIEGEAQTGLMRIALKLFEKQQMIGRFTETGGIKTNMDLQKEIDQKLFDSRSDYLEDNYKLAEDFVGLYTKLNQLRKIKNTSGVRKIFEQEADELLIRFLMANLLQTGHGEKMNVFSEIHVSINKLYGEIDYCSEKVRFFNSYEQIGETSSYAFLSQ